MLIITVQKIALPSLEHRIFQVHSDSIAYVDKTFMLQHAKVQVFTHKTNALHGKPDRTDNSL